MSGVYNPQDLDHFAVSVIKGLVMDGVNKAKSGHPGGPFSSSDFAYILFKEFLNYDPDNAEWFDRDRFVLSAGHESMLLYSLLTLQGRMTVDDLKQFRQWGSRTPGHPEVEHHLGIECTTGPLGQGVGMGAGMGVAEAILNHKLGAEICDHYTYILAGDGDLQESVAIGASASAAHWGLGKIIMFYDRNAIQISGGIDRADSTDVAKLFESIGWHVTSIDGHSHSAIRSAIKNAQAEKGRPSIIIGKTVMAKGSAGMEGDPESHGAPFTDDEIKATRTKLGLPVDQSFYLPEETVNHFRSRFGELRKRVSDWKGRLDKKLAADPEFKKSWEIVHEGKLPADFLKTTFAAGEGVATRSAFGKVMAELADTIPNLTGGSADLEPSNETKAFMKKVRDFTKSDRGGRNFAFGVKEFPMGTIVNGIALHGGLKSFGATFLVFSDYEKAAIRLSALQNLPVMHIFTHDSFYLGEDGPTHQPIEHLASLRTIPNLVLIRPCDANETAAALEFAMEQTKRPTTIVLTRQKLKTIAREASNDARLLKKGAYIMKGSASEKPELIIIATGSEVELALGVAERLAPKKVRVVSMPSTELFDEQPESYRESILPSDVEARVTIEAGATFGWHKYAGLKGLVFGIDHFGASAPAEVLAKEFGFTVDNVVAQIQKRFK
jgi:transketolase